MGTNLVISAGHNKSENVRLWTLQPLYVWEILQRKDFLYVDPVKIPEMSRYREAYDWMREQMAQRLPNYEGHYPWWAYDYKVDLRSYRYQFDTPGARFVRLELAIPKDRVLLSAYGAWHYVLNRWYLPSASEYEEYKRQADAWSEELRRNGIDDTVSPLPEPYETIMVSSWSRVFDVMGLRHSNTIQATFECLSRNEVMDVTEFVVPAVRTRD